MKNILFLLFSLLLILTFSDATAQNLSKAEKKALKKELKEYKKDLANYAKVKDTQKKDIDALSKDIAVVKDLLSEALSDNEKLSSKIILLQAKYNNLLAASEAKEQMPNGIIYQVQMGYYEHLNLQSFNNVTKHIKAEEIDGAKRYVVGYFENVEDALEFRTDIQKLGIKDAFVSQYIDGERVMNFDATKIKK